MKVLPKEQNHGTAYLYMYQYTQFKTKAVKKSMALTMNTHVVHIFISWQTFYSNYL